MTLLGEVHHSTWTLRFPQIVAILSLLSLILDGGSRCELSTVPALSLVLDAVFPAVMVLGSELGPVVYTGQQNCSECSTRLGRSWP